MRLVSTPRIHLRPQHLEGGGSFQLLRLTRHQLEELIQPKASVTNVAGAIVSCVHGGADPIIEHVEIAGQRAQLAAIGLRNRRYRDEPHGRGATPREPVPDSFQNTRESPLLPRKKRIASKQFLFQLSLTRSTHMAHA